jgi:hypothetical protein
VGISQVPQGSRHFPLIGDRLIQLKRLLQGGDRWGGLPRSILLDAQFQQPIRLCLSRVCLG